MAYITLQRAADDPNQALLLNTEHIISVELKPYLGSIAATHQVEINAAQQAPLSAYFSTLEKARTAYDNLANALAPDAATVIFY